MVFCPDDDDDDDDDNILVSCCCSCMMLGSCRVLHTVGDGTDGTL